MRITSTPNNGTHYVAGEAITTRLDLPAHLHSGNTATSQMKLDIGARQRRAASTTPYSFALPGVDYSYTVVADDVDTDGIGIPANAIVVSGQPWRTAGAQFINLNNAALSSQAAHKVIGSTAYISATNPSPLNEETLNGATVTVALDGLTYASGVTDSDFLLATTVQNLSIASVGSVSSGDTAATLTLAFTGDSGFETPGTLAVAMVASAHSGTSALTTGSVPVQPAAPRASISSTSPAALTEASLHTAQVTVALANATYASGVTTASFELVTDIPSVSIASVSSVSSGDTTATLTLAFSGDFSAVDTLAVQVKAAPPTPAARTSPPAR